MQNDINTDSGNAMNISVTDADRLISLHDSNAALLYLYVLRTGITDPEKASKALLMPRKTAYDTFEVLELAGLLGGRESKEDSKRVTESAAKPARTAEAPGCRREELKAQRHQDDVFSALVTEAETVMNHQASLEDLRKLMEIYQTSELSSEVIMELMHYVADSYLERYGGRRKPSMTAIMKEAAVWKSMGITDLDHAEHHIKERRSRKETEKEIRDALNIYDRDFTDTEREYVDSWADWGFPTETISLAYDVAIANKGIRNIAYINGILRRWHSMDLHSPEAVMQSVKITKQTRDKVKTSQASTIDVEKIRILEESLKNKNNR